MRSGSEGRVVLDMFSHGPRSADNGLVAGMRDLTAGCTGEAVPSQRHRFHRAWRRLHCSRMATLTAMATQRVMWTGALPSPVRPDASGRR